MFKKETFELRLNKKPFESIKNCEKTVSVKGGTKTIEMRLYDEKRQQINIGDFIVFKLRDNEEEQIKTVVQDVDVFLNFEELYKNYDKVSLGYKNDEDASYKDMEEYYSKEEQAKYGVVAITVELVKE